MYVNIPKGEQTDGTQRSASLLVQTNGLGAYRWKIRLTQVNCMRNPAEAGSSGSYVRRRSERVLSKFRNSFASLKVTIPAPSGCLQYYTEPRGTIMSFNFGQYLTNMDYAICIERQPTTCKISMRADEFGIDKSGSGKSTSGVGDVDCAFSFLSIPASSATGDPPMPTRDRYCGGFLNYISGRFNNDIVVSKANGPIVLRFHTSSTYDHSVKSGFKITYEQSSNCEPVVSDQTSQMSQPQQLFPYSNAAVVATAAVSESNYANNKLSVNPDQKNQNSNNYDIERREESRVSRINAKRFRF